MIGGKPFYFSDWARLLGLNALAGGIWTAIYFQIYAKHSENSKLLALLMVGWFIGLVLNQLFNLLYFIAINVRKELVLITQAVLYITLWTGNDPTDAFFWVYCFLNYVCALVLYYVAARRR